MEMDTECCSLRWRGNRSVYLHMKKYNILATLISISFLWGGDSRADVQLPADDTPMVRQNKAVKISNGKIITFEVTATAYTSNANETDSTPNLTAWGDTLQPGMKVIAVSRDLIKMGLIHNAKVTIEGLKGEYVVRDKMHRRWSKKIDIYMGNDRKKALAWGKRKVIIHWVR